MTNETPYYQITCQQVPAAVKFTVSTSRAVVQVPGYFSFFGKEAVGLVQQSEAARAVLEKRVHSFGHFAPIQLSTSLCYSPSAASLIDVLQGKSGDLELVDVGQYFDLFLEVLSYARHQIRTITLYGTGDTSRHGLTSQTDNQGLGQGGTRVMLLVEALAKVPQLEQLTLEGLFLPPGDIDKLNTLGSAPEPGLMLNGIK